MSRCRNCHTLVQECSCGAPKGVKPGKLELSKNQKLIEQTLSDPKINSILNIKEDILKFIQDRTVTTPVDQVEARTWLTWILEWASDRGRCKYANGETGIAPATAKRFFRTWLQVVAENFDVNLLLKYPHFSKFTAKWQMLINRESLYRRKQANYFSQEDVKRYMVVFNKEIEQGSESQAHYARMAKVIILVSVLFAGCRLGALLDIRVAAVKFVSIETDGQHNLVVALFPGGSKTDFDNQRTSPITFGQLPDKSICPVTCFIEWVKYMGWRRKENALVGNASDFIFPMFKGNKKLATNSFSKKVQKMETKWAGDLPHFQAHVGRFTITTLAMFGKDKDGSQLISTDLLEHQLSWVRQTRVLPNYMGHNSVLAKNGFLDLISKVRKEGLDEKIDEKAVKTFWSNNLDETLLTNLEF